MLTSSKKFRKILNDLKRRPEDAAKDLGVSKKRVQKILRNKTFSDINILEKAVKVWPVNYSDFFLHRMTHEMVTKFLGCQNQINLKG